MQIDVQETEGIVVLTLTGKLMGGPEAGEVNDKIHELIGAGKRKIVIDMQGLEWMNSSGLGIFIGAVNTLKNNGGELVMIHVPQRIMQLLRMTRLLQVFSIKDSLEEAKKALLT